MWLNLFVIILCVNALLGFIGYGTYVATQYKFYNPFIKYKVLPLWKEFYIICFITLIASITGFFDLYCEIKEKNYKNGFKLIAGRCFL